MHALLNYFESEKLLYLPPPQQKLISWFKDNLGRISTTENCIFFPFHTLMIPYFDWWWVLRTRTFHRTQVDRKVPSCPWRCRLLHTAKSLHHPGQLTEQAVKQEIFIEDICELVMWHKEWVHGCTRQVRYMLSLRFRWNLASLKGLPQNSKWQTGS